MGTCCNTVPPQHDLDTDMEKPNDFKANRDGHGSITKGQDFAQSENEAAVSLQKHFRGLMTRRAIKA